MKQFDLCRICLEAMKSEGHKVSLVRSGADSKITCGRCGKRRYGGTYTVIPNPDNKLTERPLCGQSIGG